MSRFTAAPHLLYPRTSVFGPPEGGMEKVEVSPTSGGPWRRWRLPRYLLVCFRQNSFCRKTPASTKSMALLCLSGAPDRASWRSEALPLASSSDSVCQRNDKIIVRAYDQPSAMVRMYLLAVAGAPHHATAVSTTHVTAVR